ncbi:neuronal acetylcholine receptor subunit alpha-10-like [Amphiura filiformis]|uniref:neuronal acetylcholine receptor subunit alpha-10-like n=1 Tax=Amphiura filiformis TaxID=82378 RepID=UPI003B20EB43
MEFKGSHLQLITTTLLLFYTAYAHQNQTVAVKRLHHHLFADYSNEFRPVHNSSTATNVILRLKFRNLLTMNTREQVFSIQTWSKLTWTDEFLTWNPKDYDGIKRHTVPVSKIWLPDITLFDSADINVAYKADTVTNIYPDGTIIWFLSNGVWDIVAVRTKRVIVKYLCCPEPYPEVHYVLVFKHHAAFYIYYMILPCFALSILSLVVFYLPPDCGEKLTYSVTNLLALIVFQQIIAGNIPPTSDDPPLIGTYFLCMIVMVCVSVIATGIVMHMSALSQPVPRWVKRVFLHFLPRVLCLSPDANEDSSDGTKTFQIANPNSRESIESSVEELHANSANQVSSTSVFEERLDKLENIVKMNLANRNGQTFEKMQWRRVSIIADRLLLNTFSLFMIVCTVYITLEVVIGSEEEYDAVKRDLEENW